MFRRRLPSVAAFAVVLAGGMTAIFAQGPALVTIDVAVEQPRPMVDASHVVPWTVATGLTVQDFEVFSDGQSCRIESLTAGRTILSIVVLIDVSAGTEITVNSLLEPLQAGLIPVLLPGDRVAFGRFGGIATKVERRFNSQHDELKEAARAALTPPTDTPAPPARPAPSDPVLAARGLNGGFGLGASPVWDAIDDATGVLESEPGRRAIILLTDGRSTGNVHSLDEAIRHAVAARTSVLVVGEGVDEEIRQSGTSSTVVRPAALLESMAGATGGAYAAVFGPEKSRPKRTDALAMRQYRFREGGEPLKPARVDEAAFKRWVGRMLAAFVGDLRAGYTLGFLAPALDGQFHTLDVRVRKTGLKVRASRQYFGRPERP